jgi:predicted acetylornithine/succinylornithine family transaminase
VYLYDSEGREYIDLISGVGVASLGHANAELARIVAEQAGVLLHSSNLFFHPYQGQLAERLASMSGLDRTFFCNSGTEGMEACLKFARRYWYTAGETGRTRIVALEGAFHGRTMGSLSVTADPHYRDPFAPLLADVTFVRANDEAALRAAVTGTTAAVVLEAIQGEGGVRPLTPAFAEAVQEACERTGALLICDEVQCGLGRTGNPFFYPVLGLRPQLVAIGKALGAGIPIGAALVAEDVAKRIDFGDHGSTYGGNLLACRAGLFFVGQLLDGGLLEHVARVGGHLEARLLDLSRTHGMVREVRGRGLMRGIDLDRPAAPVVDAARARGLLVNGTARTVVRMLPPLTITEPEIDQAIDRLAAALAEVAGAPR